MSVSDIKLFQSLKNRLGEQEAEDLVTYVKSEVKAEFDNKRENLATKEDLNNVRTELLKSIYIVGFVQFLGIIGSILLIIKYLAK